MAAALGVVSVLGVACGPAPQARVPTAGWHLSWRAETIFETTTTATTSCRFLARLTGTGSRVRAEFTSTAGTKGYWITAASLAQPRTPTSLDVAPGSSRPLTFGGRGGVPVTGGRSVLSDPLPLSVRPDTPMLITVTATAGDAALKATRPEPAACTTGQPASVATAAGSAFPAAANVHWLRSLLVDGPAQRSIVALGDSITEGPDGPGAVATNRWSDTVASTGVVVANAGVGGNAVSRPGIYRTASGVTRARALLAEPNVTDLVVLMGTNDLSFGESASEVLGGLGDIVRRRRKARRVTVSKSTHQARAPHRGRCTRTRACGSRSTPHCAAAG